MKHIILAILTFLILLLSSCTTSIPTDKVCQIDQDCVPKLCCHSDESVNKENSPDCSATLCSLDCEPGTIDCGQGGVACVEGSCQVVLYDQ